MYPLSGSFVNLLITFHLLLQEDSDFSDHIEDKHTSLRDKFRQFQEILVLVQNILGYVADMEEGVKK